MSAERSLSPRARLFFGLLCVAAGTLPILAAFDVGPLRSSDINGPPWLAGVAGGVFVLAGAALLAGEERSQGPLAFALFILVLGAFAAIGNWIAFGPGPRECSGGFTAFFFSSTRAAAEFECRAAFGVGALIVDGALLCVLARLPKKLLGDGPATLRLEKLGECALLLSLAPILLPLLLFGIGASLFAGLREWLRTGSWPRNEAFIERMRKRRERPPPA